MISNREKNIYIANEIIKKYICTKDFKNAFLSSLATRDIILMAKCSVENHLKDYEKSGKLSLDGLKIYAEMDGTGVLCIWTDIIEIDDSNSEEMFYVN